MRILLLSNHALIWNAVRNIIDSLEGIEIYKNVISDEEIIKLCSKLKPELIITDLLVYDESRINKIEEIKRKFSLTPVLLLIGSDEIFRRLKTVGETIYNVEGLVEFTANSNEIKNAIKIIINGKKHRSKNIRAIMEEGLNAEYKNDNDKPPEKDSYAALLTHKERELIALIAQGLGSAQIAEKLFVSVKTVEGHKENLKNKLNIKSCKELFVYSIEYLKNPPPPEKWGIPLFQI